MNKQPVVEYCPVSFEWIMIKQFTHTASEDVERIADWFLLYSRNLPARRI